MIKFFKISLQPPFKRAVGSNPCMGTIAVPVTISNGGRHNIYLKIITFLDELGWR
jgi:hypothetical protein